MERSNKKRVKKEYGLSEKCYCFVKKPAKCTKNQEKHTYSITSISSVRKVL